MTFSWITLKALANLAVKLDAAVPVLMIHNFTATVPVKMASRQISADLKICLAALAPVLAAAIASPSRTAGPNSRIKAKTSTPVSRLI